MIKKMKIRNTTRRKFISGIGLISAGIILRPSYLFSQEDNPILNIGSPIDFLSEKLISKHFNEYDIFFTFFSTL